MPRRSPPPAATRRPVAAAVALLLAAPAGAQTVATTTRPDPLAPLVAEGLRHNLGLAQLRLAADRATVGVRQARGAFLPSVAADARYTRAQGNVLNLGDLVNPAFRTLNQLTGSTRFPTNVDLQQPFPQTTNLRVAQPLFVPAVAAGYGLARVGERQQQAALGAGARRVAAGIRTAYLGHARARQLVAIYAATLPLVVESRRVNERLVARGQATPDAVARTEAEVSEVEQELAAARAAVSAAARQLNQLVGRPLDAPVPALADSLLAAAPLPPLDAALRAAAAGREELRQASLGVDAAAAQRRLARAAYLPAVVAAVDYGVQGADYRFGPERDYLLATVSLQWNLFNGGQDRARVEQASLDAARADAARADAERQVAAEVETAHENAAVAERAIATATARLTSAERSFRLVQRRHAEGLATLVEFIDARTSYTRAALNRVATTYDYLARRAELDRAAALTPLPTLVNEP